MPKAELGVGIGFYGSCWAGGVTGPRQQLDGSTIVADDNIMSFTNIMKRYYAKQNYHYDTKAQAPYLGYRTPHGPQHCTFVSYENSRSIKAKATWAPATRPRGVDRVDGERGPRARREARAPRRVAGQGQADVPGLTSERQLTSGVLALIRWNSDCTSPT